MKMMNFLGSNLGLYPGMGLFQLIGVQIKLKMIIELCNLNGYFLEGAVGVLVAYKIIAKAT